jgi:ribosomal protein L2
MTVKRKAKPQTSLVIEKENEISKLINKGGSTTSEKSTKKEIKYTLRISSDLAKQIDDVCNSRVGKISRNTWILEAIMKHLEVR